MANTLTNLIPAFYKALNVVSRELVGFANSVTLDADVAQAAIGQTVYSFEAPAATASTIVPAMTPPTPADQTIGSTPLTITKSKRSVFLWNGEEEKGLNMNGAGAGAIQQAQIEEAIRALVNEMEADIFAAARVSASRAYGTAGTTPFASDLSAAAQVRKILDDNGAPGQRSLIIDTNAGVNLRTLTQLTKVNEAGTQMTLRDGELLDLFGMSTKESAAIVPVTKGTGASYLTNSASLVVGTTTIPADTGTGTILAGDVVTFAGDTNKYVVKTALSGGSFAIGGPGLRVAIADNAAITVGNTATENVAFAKSAVVMATRSPAVPAGGDLAVDRTVITDPFSGISFTLDKYLGFFENQYGVSAAWGVTGIKPAHTALLLG